MERFERNPTLEQHNRIILTLKFLTRVMSVILEPEFEKFSQIYFWETWHENTGIQKGRYILRLIMKLMFLPNFTVDTKVPYKLVCVKQPEELLFDHVWGSGIGITRQKAATPAMIEARLVLIRLLLVCLSQQIYYPLGLTFFIFISYFLFHIN